MAGGSHARGSTPRRKRKAPPPAAAAAEDEAELEAQKLRREVEELEDELADLDRRVLEHVRSNAARLVDAAVTRPTALRPQELPTASESSVAEEDQGQLDKLNILKSKIEATIADLPKVLEERNESVVRCEKMESLTVNIHPVFRRKLM
nr:unnamed protein product [Digitaria exilis]